MLKAEENAGVLLAMAVSFSICAALSGARAFTTERTAATINFAAWLIVAALCLVGHFLLVAMIEQVEDYDDDYG